MSDSLFTVAERKVAYESIVEQIEGAVAAGRLKAGDRLPGERQLMAEFGVSRSTVREALKVLQATGSITSKPGDPRGPIITNYSPTLLENSIQRFARLDSISRAEILQFRVSLESTACRLAAELHDDEELDRIVEAQRRMEIAATEETVEFPEATNLFDDSIKAASHNEIIRVCGNAVAGVMRELVYSRLAEDPDRKARMVKQARAAGKLVDAIRARESTRAAAIVRHNIFRFYAGVLSPEEDRQTRVLVYLEGDDFEIWEREIES